MVALADVAVNLYHTPLVVVDVAPPQAPVGAAFVAPCKSPVVGLHVIDGLSVAALEQLDCEYVITEVLIARSNRTAIRAVDGCNIVFQVDLDD